MWLHTPISITPSRTSNAATLRFLFLMVRQSSSVAPDFLGEYFSGLTEQQANAIHALNPFLEWGQAWGPVYNRDGLVEGTPFLPGEISDVNEQTQAMYARLDFGIDGDIPVTGNFGIRYVETTIESGGEVQFSSAAT